MVLIDTRIPLSDEEVRIEIENLEAELRLDPDFLS